MARSAAETERAVWRAETDALAAYEIRVRAAAILRVAHDPEIVAHVAAIVAAARAIQGRALERKQTLQKGEG